MRTTLRRTARAAVIAGLCGGLALSGSAMAIAAPATGDQTQANLLYSVDGGTTWTDTVTAERGQQVLARLFYDTTKDTPVTGTSLTTQIPDGFTYVPGTTRNVLAPGSDVTTGTVGAETKAVAVTDSVWTGDNLQVSPSAGFNGESNASQTGTLRNGTKRYLNLHQCDFVLRSSTGTERDQFRYVTNLGGGNWGAGTNASNTADSAASCGAGGAGDAGGTWVLRNSQVAALDLLGNRYVNLQECDYVMPSVGRGDVARWVTNLGGGNWGAPSTAANAPKAAGDCGPGGTNNGLTWELNGDQVEVLDTLGNRYVNLHQCDYAIASDLTGNPRYRYTTNAGSATGNWAVGTNASNAADAAALCGPGSAGWELNGQGVRALDLLDAARGQGFIEFAFTSEAPEPPACEQTVTEPAITSTRQGVLNGTGTGTPTSTAAITLAEYTATGDPCPEELAANTDEYTTVQDTTLTGNVLDNDVIPDGSTITVTGPGAGPWNGDLTLNEDGTFTYTPAPGYVGTDSFSYTITDQDGNTSVGTVNITITEDENGIPLIAPGAAATAGLLGLAGLGLGYTRRRETTNEVI